jgi:hypothetical protein
MDENGRMFVSAVMHSIRLNASTGLGRPSNEQSTVLAIRWLDPLLRGKKQSPGYRGGENDRRYRMRIDSCCSFAFLVLFYGP